MVHGNIGALDQQLLTAAVFRIDGHAYARGNLQAVSRQLEGLVEGMKYLLPYLAGILLRFDRR